MFFMDNQGGTRHIRLATSDDAKNWTVDSNEVVTPQPQHDGNVSNPFFFKYDGDYLVAFHATSDNIYAMEGGQNIGKENYLGEIMTPVSQDDGGAAGPFFIKDDSGNCYIYYVAGNGNKQIVTQARMVWLNARLAGEGYGQEYADLAEHGLNFLLEDMWDKVHGGFYWEVKRHGTVSKPNKHLYGQSFGLYALSEHARSLDDDRATKYAHELVNLMDETREGRGVRWLCGVLHAGLDTERIR